MCFSLPMIAGDPHTALLDAHTVVITERMAKKYFDAVDVVGRTLVMNDSIPYKVTGVIRDLPAQCHFHYDFFVSMTESKEAREQDNWLSNNFNTYIVLRRGGGRQKAGGQIRAAYHQYIAPELRAAVNVSVDDFFKAGNSVGFSLTPLTAIHLHSNKTAELGANGNIQYVYIFSAVAAFILLIACVNFMNLSTARSSNRAQGGWYPQGAGFIAGESHIAVYAGIGVDQLYRYAVGVGVGLPALPVFNRLSDKHMSIGLFSRPWLLPEMVGLVLVVGVLAGSYPAFFLSAFRPIAVLKGNVAAGFKTGWLRNSLVVFQFGISIFLLVGTTVIYRQLGYIHNRQLGFNREEVLIVNNTGSLVSRRGPSGKSCSSYLVWKGRP